MKKTYINILKIVAIWMVFNFHYTIIIGKEEFLYWFANGDWGCVGTTLFLLISGNSLARKYGEKLNVKEFYKKRWLAIFPMFYLCYFIAFVLHRIILQNDISAGVEPWTFIFTLMGADNYMYLVGVPTFAIVGEWYTALIVAIYILFPLIQLLYRKKHIIGTILILVMYGLNLVFDIGPVIDDAHLITGVTVFWIGMLTYKYEEKIQKAPLPAKIMVVVLALVLMFVKLPGVMLLYKNLFGILIFITFMFIGKLIDSVKEPAVIGFLCKIEYGIYLCHHAVLYVMSSAFKKLLGGMYPVGYYFASLVATIMFATVLYYCINFKQILYLKKNNKCD